MALQRFGSSGPLMAITRGDLVLLLPLMAAAFTGPALGLGWSLPPGVAAEAARLGLALSLLAAPLAVLLARRRG
jgi:NhaA family Na+:H+ antiporter